MAEAKLTRDTAKRSIAQLLDSLPRDAVVLVQKRGQLPPPGVAVAVRLEISTGRTSQRNGLPVIERSTMDIDLGQPADLRADKRGKETDHAQFQRRGRPNMGSGGQRRRR